ncbi:LysR family transcriptional regulator [Methylopila turkensis]|uniref:LysR family transcriptional regulator n=1 Tax=Methylopila turkensis TaxID=1437816 RepID=A0A9W6JPE5_9HYPH|nr:LysR family transcriptional regulator [Methylopila turkensis]GLK80091.1 LysR family transcriptional regulator [Methylopila turkensis]
MDLDDVALFHAIASAGSLSGAGRQAGLSPMAVSRRLATLEKELGVRLFHRTTRSVALTSDGETFLPLAQSMLEAREAAAAAFAESREAGLSGVLRITAPNLIGRSIVVPLAVRLMAENPLLTVDLTLSDGIVDIVAGGIDVAIRVATLQESGLVAIKVADNPRILCAAPSHVQANGAPRTLAELDDHVCLTLHAMDAWVFVQAGRRVAKRVVGRLSASSVDAVRAACHAGAGFALLTYWDVAQDLADGRLVAAPLGDAATEPLAIWAVLPTRRHVPVRVRRFIDEMKALLSKPPA